MGEANWEDAKELCRNYRGGGGYSDWYLQNQEELNWIYMNLRKTGKIAGDSRYWSSSFYSSSCAWNQSFSGGFQFNFIDSG